jgi:hypothetical protein
MAAVAEKSAQLRATDGFLVESPEGDIGRVEEVWVDEAEEPCALAVKTTDGRHALLLGEEVVTVDREQRWVVVQPRPALLELDPPRLTALGHGAGRAKRIAASWATTGALVPVSTRSPRGPSLHLPRLTVTADGDERPLWQLVTVLYTVLAFVVAFVITLAFLMAWLVSGAAY